MEITDELIKDTKVAYISMEAALDSNIPTYSGGLGVLSGDTIRSAADLEIPMVAICLCYSSGYFYQLFNEKGEQKEKEIEWSFFYEFDKVEKPIEMMIENKTMKVSAWLYRVIGQSGHVIPIYLLTTDVKGNEPWMLKLTGSLYDSTSRWNRIVQEMILGIGGVRLLNSLGYENIKTYHINEGHGAFSTLELYNNYGKNIEEVREKVAFTTHTPVPAGHDRFDYSLVNKVFEDRYPAKFKELGDQDGKLNMTVLAMNCSRYINAVAQKHGVTTREMFPNYDIDAITNGVHLPFWVSKPIKKIFDRKWPNWKANPSVLSNAIEIDDLELFDAHIENKFNLISYQKGHSWNLLDEELITIGFARRFATYKRAILPFHDLDRLGKICQGEVQFIYAGKAHPKDNAGKDYIKKIFEAGDYLYNNYGVKVVVMENYNVDLAHMLVSGVDVWLNCPERYREASGTSGMKAALNGILNFSVLDGWWIEGFKKNKEAGWAIGKFPEEYSESETLNDWERDANEIYETIENKIIPTYMNHDEWLFKCKNAISLAAFFNTHRMVEEYAKKAYQLVKQKPWKHIG
ncbi:MAG: alpha-glucan family phosphorylase [Candidatus Lokiarchaeota archaeon]|nr:alpha-glucan family phosphorylase [Candidatus Lokiarchaeota archaeon]MBD3198991.1 alpha-glucan family phosphorylase [Candidatus Lokiarchaeota archaeon]